MIHFDSQDAYDRYVQQIADVERERSDDVPAEEMLDYDDYEGYEDEYTIAKMVVSAPTRVSSDEVTMWMVGEPYADERVCPAGVFLRSPHASAVPDEMIANNDIYEAAIYAMARDIADALTERDD